LTEEIIVQGAKEIKKKIKGTLLDRDMTQVELAKLLDVNPQVLNRAVHGDMSPRSIQIRKEIYKVLGLK
jgi:ribosome-binding protein aMBF1 (putative translation factor)